MLMAHLFIFFTVLVCGCFFVLVFAGFSGIKTISCCYVLFCIILLFVAFPIVLSCGGA
jgi:hypothetical protein